MTNLVKMFLWRACSNILPTKENLMRMGVLKEDVCILGSQEVKSMRHALWDCPSTRDVWGAYGRKFQKAQVRGSNFRDAWETLIQRCSKDELAFGAILA